MGVLNVFLNLVMAGLLLATLIYCLKLNKRIKILQDSKSELSRIVREFDESTQRATKNINEIHAATARISENIQHKIDKANYLADDLEMLISRGNKMAGKTDETPVRPVREQAPVAPAAPMEPVRQKRSLADIMPGRSREAAASVEPAVGEPEGRRPLRTRSRAEQELMNLMGKKEQ